MLVRFTVLRRNACSQVEDGLFQAAHALRASGALAPAEEALVADVFRWFGARLPRPRRFARSTRPHAQAKAVCWFRDTAAEHLARMEDLVAILRTHGQVVQRLTTDRPGYVVYEDAYQVVSEPFRGERRPGWTA